MQPSVSLRLPRTATASPTRLVWLLLAGGLLSAAFNPQPTWLLLGCAALLPCLLRKPLPHPAWRVIPLLGLLLIALISPPAPAEMMLLLLGLFALVGDLPRPTASQRGWRLGCAVLGSAPLLALALLTLLSWPVSEQPLLNCWVLALALLLGVPGMRRTVGSNPVPAQRAVELALLLQAGVAVLVLTGWFLHSALVVQAATYKVPMQFNTALCHLLVAGGLWLVLQGKVRVGLGVSLLVMVVAALALLEELAGLPLNLGEWIWQHRIHGEHVQPGRMAPNTAAALLVGSVGAWLAAAALRHSRWWPLVWTCGTLVAVAALAVLAGYALDLSQVRALGERTPMALLTAVAFLAHGAALVLAGREHDAQRHQQVWLPVLMLCSAVVLTLQVGRAVSTQREQLAEQALQSRADAVHRLVEHGMDLRMEALHRMAQRLSTQPDPGAAFERDAQLYIRDFPSLSALALLDAELGVLQASNRNGDDSAFPWQAYDDLQARIDAATASPDLIWLSAPRTWQEGPTAVLLIPFPAAAAPVRFMVAAIRLDRLFDDLLDPVPGHALEFRDGTTLLYRHEALNGGRRLGQEQQLQVPGRIWTMQVWLAAEPALDRISLALLLAGLLTGATLALLVRYAGLALQRAREAAASHAELLQQIERGDRIRVALDASEDELRSALGSMTDALILLDQDWHVVYVNGRAGELVRRDPVSLLGKLMWEEFPEVVGSVFQQAYFEAMRQQQLTVVESYYPPLQTWFEARCHPHRRGLAIYFRDVTAGKLVEQEQAKLRLESERAQRLARLGSWERELPDGRLHCSPLARDILGLPADLIPTRPEQLYQAVHPEDAQAVQLAHLQLASGERRELEHRFRVRLADGRIRHLYEIVARVQALAERPALLSAAIQDVSQLHATEIAQREAVEQLRLRNRELQEFNFVASHDLQEPLRKIRTFADRLQHRGVVASDPQAHDDLDRMTAAAARMQQLIEDLLAFARIGQRAPSTTQVDLNRVLASVLEDLSERIRAGAAQIEAEPLPVLQADATQMRQLLQNLLSNALKFARRDVPMRIGISARSEETEQGVLWTLDIRDNGIGFDNKHSERIFTPFQRLHARNTYEGTGIGLAIVRRIIERHQGSVSAHSTPGQGTCFTVVLPQVQTPSASA